MSLVAGRHTSEPATTTSKVRHETVMRSEARGSSCLGGGSRQEAGASHSRGHDSPHTRPGEHQRQQIQTESYSTRRGLVNLGNTCYMNACIQMLASVPELQHALVHALSQYERREVQAVPTDAVAPWTKGLCSVFRDLGRVSRSPVRPTVIISNIERLTPSLHRGRQEDVHEALLGVLDKLESECATLLERAGTVMDTEHAHAAGSAAHSNVVQTLFHGSYRSTRTCPSCDKTEVTHEPFIDVTLSMDDGCYHDR